MTNDNLFIIFFLGLTALIVIACLIAWAIAEIQSKVEKKKREKLIQDYPELKLLLSEYMRLTNEHSQTWSDYNSLKKDIDEWENKNHYYPKDKKIDGHIEELKKGLWELQEIEKEQGLLVKKARKELELFWATNFPNLKEEKRIMWWYW
jgi:predicted patatin/cPLA2 family phospholipase